MDEDEDFITLEQDPNLAINFDPNYDSEGENYEITNDEDYPDHERLSYTPNESISNKSHVYKKTLHDLQYELEDSIRDQKEESLGLALEIFDRIKKIQLHHTHTLNSKEINADAIELEDPQFKERLTTELKKLKYSFDDSTSPTLSYVKDLHRQGLAGDTKNAKDLDKVVTQLEAICDELENKERTMLQLEQAYSHSLSQEDSKAPLKNKEGSQEALEAEIFEAYLEYQRGLLKELDYGTGSSFNTQKPEQHKIQVIRNVFGVMEPGKMANVGSDLIEFGIAHNVPDAVRLGENLSGLNNEDIPDYLLNRLNQYKLKNADKLRERIQHTGPMKSIIQRRKENLMTQEDRTGYFPSNYDELKTKYNDKYNRWRLPSVYAVDHKRYGLLGELYGEERLERFLR